MNNENVNNAMVNDTRANVNDNCQNPNDTRVHVNDTRSVFASINPLKRRVSFRDIPNIREFEQPSSSTAPSPLPSGFLDTTHTIFKSLMVAQTPTKLLKVDEVAKYGSLDEQLDVTHVIQHTPFRNRHQSPLLLDDLTKQHASSLLFGSQDNYGLDELSEDARSMNISIQQQQLTISLVKSAAQSSASSADAMTMITETPKSSHHSTATRTVPIDFEDDRVSESPQLPPPPTVPIPMGHLNDSEFEQWHETEMDEAMEGYCDAVKQYTDKYSRLAAEKKRLLSRIDAVKERIFKFRSDFSEAYQQNEEKRRALCADLTNI
ncbi:hypothetical protein niasHT_024473 [Heterodera trifolii]|uniref:Uncharacterized protein n=1 Tax=Heterodera trifolii TaxID=157864 RepID=A0ABD2K7G0_9BILA